MGRSHYFRRSGRTIGGYGGRLFWLQQDAVGGYVWCAIAQPGGGPRRAATGPRSLGDHCDSLASAGCDWCLAEDAEEGEGRRADSRATSLVTCWPTSTQMWIARSALGPEVHRQSSAGPEPYRCFARRNQRKRKFPTRTIRPVHGEAIESRHAPMVPDRRDYRSSASSHPSRQGSAFTRRHKPIRQPAAT
jgi:hypothetical protein